MSLCIIPARGGSKRIPGKNIRNFRGRPIITYPIATAIDCGYDVIVSTDDAEIERIAREAGAEVKPRMGELSGDDVEVEEVLASLLGDVEDDCLMMFPTSVFATPNDIEEALHGWNVTVDLLYSVVEYDHPIQRALTIDDGRVKMMKATHKNTQDYKPRYHDAAQFYLFDPLAFMAGWNRGKRLIELNAEAHIYARNEVQDIDTPVDWAIAEMKYKELGR